MSILQVMPPDPAQRPFDLAGLRRMLSASMAA
ncbi:MAG: hypothetical protein JWN93_882, partial [Hyphomicrobiales bacterium]|nr:hypothetical protein [Hyphomicrobiales bacterium]